VFYILAAEKERLKALKLWCQLHCCKSNEVSAVMSDYEMKAVPAQGDPGGDPGDGDEAGAAAGLGSAARQDGGGAPSQALGQVTSWTSVVEMHNGPAHKDPGHGRAAAGQSSGARQAGGGAPGQAGAGRHGPMEELDPSLLPGYIREEDDSSM
jgi:hypothetical protein